MSTLHGKCKGHRFHGAPERFDVVAEFIHNRYGRNIKYIADIAGGRGMLTRILNKKYNYEAEVVDPRGWTLKGVPNRAEIYSPELASYYDLIVGLHPDEATRAVAESAFTTRTLLVPCCNFWDKGKKLGRDALVEAIADYYKENDIPYEIVTLDFKSSRNIALVTEVH